MASRRYIMVKGKPGVAVSNPWALGSNPRNFAGKQRDPALDGEPEMLDKYADKPEVLLSHADLVKSCAEGDIELLGQCVATSFDEAAKLMAVKPKSVKVD